MKVTHPIVALATPYAKSALALIRISGNGCIEKSIALFRNGKRLLRAAGNTIHLDYIVDLNTQQIVDHVQILLYRTPKSYTGEDSLEITCHGNPHIISKIIALFLTIGFKEALPGEFTQRALLTGKMDLTQAEAVQEIVDADGAAAYTSALHRLNGQLRDEIDAIKKQIIQITAGINVQLDYPVEESGAIQFDVGALKTIMRSFSELIASYQLGKLYQDGIIVVLTGKTNAGKSSIFNRLVQEERAIISPTHGTTRDYIESALELAGIPIRLFDTAGIRSGENAIESEGIQKSEEVRARAQIILYVIDGTLSDNKTEYAQINALQSPHNSTGQKRHVLTLINKADLPQRAIHTDLPHPPLTVSAKTGAGIATLVAALVTIINREKARYTHTPEQDSTQRMVSGAAPVIVSTRQRLLLQQAHDALQQALQQFEQHIPLDMLVLDFEAAIRALGEITGAVSTDDMLTEMFRNFCVGK